MPETRSAPAVRAARRGENDHVCSFQSTRGRRCARVRGRPCSYDWHAVIPLCRLGRKCRRDCVRSPPPSTCNCAHSGQRRQGSGVPGARAGLIALLDLQKRPCAHPALGRGMVLTGKRRFPRDRTAHGVALPAGERVDDAVACREPRARWAGRLPYGHTSPRKTTDGQGLTGRRGKLPRARLRALEAGAGSACCPLAPLTPCAARACGD